MIIPNNQSDECATTWQKRFAEILPEIDRRLRREFRFLDREARDEAVEEGTVHCLLSYSRLFGRGRTDYVSPSTLTWYAVLQVKRGRPAAGRMNGTEPLSRYAQVGQGIRIELLHSKWIDTLVEDKRSGVADQVAAKLDVERLVRHVDATDETDCRGSRVRLHHIRGSSEARHNGRTNQPAAPNAERVVAGVPA